MEQKEAKIAQNLCECLYILGAIDGKIYNQIRAKIREV